MLVAEDYQLPELQIPILVQLGLTYRCNLKCSHCYALYRRDRDEFTLEEVEHLAEELYQAGSCSVVYSHGENMIRRDFHDIAVMFRDRDFYQTLMLNGYYVRSSIDAARLKSAGIDRTMVSMDSTDPVIHDGVRGRRGAFNTAVRALTLLKDVELPTVGLSTTIDSHNYDNVEEIVTFAENLGLDAVSFMQNRYNRKSIFDRSIWQQYRDVCSELYELTLRYQGRLDIYTHDPFMLTLLDERMDDPQQRADFIGANLCNVGTSMVSIDPVGNVTGCNFIDEAIGNIREEPFAEIWQRLVDRYSDANEPPTGPCGDCSVLGSCMGGCKAFHYSGKYDERCGSQRFRELRPHGLPTSDATNTGSAPARAPGVFLGMPRPRMQTEQGK